MGIFEGLGIVLIPIFLGYYLGSLFTKLNNFSSKMATISLLMLLFIMGFKLALIDDLSKKLPLVGVQAVIFTIILHLANFIVMIGYDKYTHRKSKALVDSIKFNWHIVVEIGKLVGSVVLGILVGFITLSLDYHLDHDLVGYYSNILLLLLILGVGLQLGAAKYSLKEIFLNKEGLICSVLFTLSCLIAGIACSYLLNIELFKSLAISSGMGWYSLSSVLISAAYGPLDGTLVFFVDMLREIIALVLVPILMRWWHCTAVTQPGATALDVSLPIIQKSGGNGVVGLAICFGFFVNLYVPILIVFFTSI